MMKWQMPTNASNEKAKNTSYLMSSVRLLVNKMYIKVQMHWSLWGVSHLRLAKLVNCNQILGDVADQDYIKFTD